MATEFEWCKLVPESTKQCVCGYIRIAQQSLSTTSAYYNIPQLVSALILQYYHQRELFVNHGQFINLDDRSKTATLPADLQPAFHGFNNVYGSIMIDHTETDWIYEWRFKILQMDDKGVDAVGIGITTQSQDLQDVEKANASKCFVDQINDEDTAPELDRIVFWCTGAVESLVRCIIYEPGQTGFVTNDVVSMTFNSKDKSLQFCINETKHPVVMEPTVNDKDEIDPSECEPAVFDKDYYMAVAIWKGGSVELLSFEQRLTE